MRISRESPARDASPAGTVWVRLTPAIFVFLWATGFVGAKFGLPYAEPATFLVTRFILVVGVMLPIALALGAPWPHTRTQTLHIAVAGALLHAGYLGGVFAAIHNGMSAGLAALIVGIQPILTAFAAVPLLGERVSGRQWAGLALGLGGLALVVMDRMTLAGTTVFAFAMALVALGSITIGTVYQKRFCGAFDLRTGSVIQFVAAGVVLAPFALAFERKPIEWTPPFLFALAWLSLAISIGAISLLAVIIRRGAATRVASLFYLVPPVTAVLAYAIFGESFSGRAMLGMSLTVIGVALVVARA